jgi:hypothetical protein
MHQVIILAGALACGLEPLSEKAYLYQPAFVIDEVLRLPAEEYVPQPGDIMLRLDPSRFWRVTHYMALAFDPNGSGIVVPRRDGSLAILEAGPNDTLWVRRMGLFKHLKGYHDMGRVWIRRRKVPLTECQSRRLMEFAEAVDGKEFALVRLGGQLTVLRSRGPLRTYFIGKPQGIKENYFCSELVTEACVYAGLMSYEKARPCATYPRDLFFGRSLNPFLNANLEVNCGWHPPARWTCSPVKAAPCGKP